MGKELPLESCSELRQCLLIRGADLCAIGFYLLSGLRISEAERTLKRKLDFIFAQNLYGSHSAALGTKDSRNTPDMPWPAR